MLFGDAYIKKAAGIFDRKLAKARTVFHSCGDGADTIVLLGLNAHGPAEDIGKCNTAARWFSLYGVERRYPVIVPRAYFRRMIPPALDRFKVYDDRTVIRFGFLEQSAYRRYVVAVDRAEIPAPEYLENAFLKNSSSDLCFDMGHRRNYGITITEARKEGFYTHLQFEISFFRAHMRQPVGNSADIFAYRHLVIVKDYYELFSRLTGIVEGLIGHTAGQSAVAYNAYDLIPPAVKGPGPCHAEGCGDRVGGMAGHKAVIWAFGRTLKAAHPIQLAQGAETVLAPGKYLMDIGLMPDVKYYIIHRTIENAVKPDGYLYNAKV